MTDRAYINGEWITPENSEIIQNINPANMKLVAEIHSATDVEVEQAVLAANTAFMSWGKTKGAERAKYLVKIADILERGAGDLSYLSSQINGKPLAESELDIEDAVSTFRYYAKAAIELDEKQETNVALAVSGVNSYVRYEPAGVAALITPWNFPLVTSSWKIAPALAAGCTVILKPSEVVSRVELEFGRIADEAGLPPGVLNILPGNGAIIGPLLTAHPDINKLSFTGGNAVGAMVMSSAANTVKSVSLELGGKSPIIVFEDADLDKAVEAVMTGIFFNCGQMCSATSRLIVHENISDNLLSRLLDAVSELKIGPGLDDGSQMGPMTTLAQYEKVLTYFETARREGLKRLTGGKALEREGLFIEPTIYQNVPPSSSLWREEIFGPVLCTQTFGTEDEAILLAHDTDFGLAATVCTSDKKRLRRISRKLRAGHIWWNMPQIVPVETSWGGFGHSGTGRELGPWGLSAYIEVKHVDFEH